MALTKILNDENKSYKPVLTDKLVYDTKPTVNSFNGITSDAVARAIAGASGEVPQVTESDNGKVLTAVYDEGGAAVEWAEAPSGIPDYSTSDDGKVLGVTVDSSGETPVASVDWVEQSGGPEYFGNTVTFDQQVPLNVSIQPMSIGSSNSTNFSLNGSYSPRGSNAIGYITFDVGFIRGNATLVIPSDIQLPTEQTSFAQLNLAYLAENGNRLAVDTGALDAANKVIKAGTYTVPLVLNTDPMVYTKCALCLEGGGSPQATEATNTLLSNNASSITLSGTKATPSISSANLISAMSCSAANNGKFLKSNGYYGYWEDVPTELPTVTGNAGKVLTVNSGATGVEWADAQGGLPSSTGWDSGKVLTVDSQGTPGWATPASPYASFNTTFDLLSTGSNVWPAYVQQSSSPAPTIDLPVGVYAYRVDGYFIASAAVDDVYNIEVRVGNNDRDCKAVGLQSDRDNGVTIRTSGILNIQSGYGISKATIYMAVEPAKSSTSSVASSYASLQLKLARL